MRRRRWLGWTGTILCALVLLMAGAVSVVVATERGTRWSVEQIAGLLPSLHIQQVSGTWLQNLHISQLRWQAPESDAQINRITLKLNLSALFQGRVEIESLKAQHASVSLTETEKPTGEIRLPPLRIPVGLVLNRATLAELHVQGLDRPLKLKQFSLRAQWQEEWLQIPHAAISWEGNAASLAGELTLRDDYPVSLKLTLQSLPLQGDVVAQLDGSIRNLQVTARLGGRWPLNATGTLHPLNPDLPFRIQANTAGPLQLGTLAISEGSLRLHGDRNAVDGEAAATTELPGLGEGQLQSQLGWQADSLTLSHLRWLQTDGHAPLYANCTLRPQAQSWRCQGQLQELALDQWLPVADAQVSAPFAVNGSYHDKFAMALALPDLDGRIGGEALQGSLQLKTEDARAWHLEELNLRAGRGELKATGTLGPSNALTVSADLPRLALFNPQWRGHLRLRGKLQGSLAAPSIQADLHIDEAGYQSWRAAQVNGQLALRAGAGEHSTLNLRLEDLTDSQLPAVSLSVRASGDRKSAQWHVEGSDGRDSAVQAQCQTATDEPLTLVTLRCARLGGRLVTPQYNLELALTDALSAEFELSGRQFRLAPFCLSADPAALCLREPFAASAEHVSPLVASISNLPTSWFAAYAPQRVESLRGSGIDAQFTVSQWAPMTASATLTLAELHWQWQTANDETALARLSGIHAVGDLNAERMTLSAAAQSDTLGRLQLDTTVLDPMNERLLAGSLSIEGLQLGAFGWLYPEGYVASGTLDAHLALGGSLSSPRAEGRIAVVGERVEIPGLTNALREVKLNAELRPEAAQFNSTFALGAGTGELRGQLTLPPQWEQWTLQAGMSTQQIELSPLPDSTMTLSSRLSLLADRESARISGDVEIAEADIQVQKLPPNVARISPDTEIVGSEGQSSQSVYTDVKVALGEQFHFSGLGAQVRLAGQLRLRHDPARGMSANGEVQIPSGRYLAYGQRLAVRDGSFLFHGPLDNPDIDLEAIREMPPDIKVVAGVHVTGPLRSPALALFSEPPMPETEAAYYLLTGRPPPETGQDSRASAESALLNLGLAGATAPIARVAERLGITDLQIGTTSTEEHYESQVSGYLSPRLYLRYSSGIGDQGSSITFQYRLTEKLILEAVSGVNQALDLLYSFRIQ